VAAPVSGREGTAGGRCRWSVTSAHLPDSKGVSGESNNYAPTGRAVVHTAWAQMLPVTVAESKRTETVPLAAVNVADSCVALHRQHP
jgi:hypothetical protein